MEVFSISQFGLLNMLHFNNRKVNFQYGETNTNERQVICHKLLFDLQNYCMYCVCNGFLSFDNY